MEPIQRPRSEANPTPFWNETPCCHTECEGLEQCQLSLWSPAISWVLVALIVLWLLFSLIGGDGAGCADPEASIRGLSCR